ncbi:MAG TPA: nitrous oxide reductase family maturation protein NosD, partial [Gemmatimonadales bacterium]|nr:nitrous oxide reductase family maturation protein NosD [Gemmatimonadales bacterium]
MIALVLALVAAAPRDTLRLGPGIHPGPLVVTRPTVILGAPGAVLRGSGVGTVLDIRARGTVVRGLRIEKSGRSPDTYDAGVRVTADSVTLAELVIRDVLFGVYLAEARGVVLDSLDIEGPPGVRESERGDGIYLYYCRGVVVGRSRIARMRDGIFFSYSDSVLVQDNRVERVRFGIHYMYSHRNRFERNVFTDNAAGGVIMFSNGLEVLDNVFAWNAGSRSYGLVLQQATDPVVRGNLVVGNGIGVFFDNVIRGEFTGNVVAANWLGLQLFSNSEDTRLTGNAILANTFDAAGGGEPGRYRFCVAGRGNYWDRAAGIAGVGRPGYDLDGDGVLDVPYQAGSPLAELARTREGLRLFLHSPAAGVLEWAERTFP